MTIQQCTLKHFLLIGHMKPTHTFIPNSSLCLDNQLDCYTPAMKPIDIKKLSIYRSGEPITDDYDLFTAFREINDIRIYKPIRFSELDFSMWVMWFHPFHIEI